MSATEIGITIDPVALITQECITVTSAMRKHARWAQSSISSILGGSGTVRSSTPQDYRSSMSTTGLGSQSPVTGSGRSGTPVPGGAKSMAVVVPKITSEGKNRVGSVSGTAGLVASPSLGTGSGDEEEGGTLASRWGLRGKKGKSVQDNPLLSAFARLRRDLAGCKDITTVDAPTVLHPFLQVVRSSSTNATITSLAVSSITKFFSYNIISIKSPRIGLGMHLLSAAITHCRFEASDTSADEVVLLRILRLMEMIMSRREGKMLPDESICDMMSTGLSMCCQARLSEVLRRSAEMAMVTMCQIVFMRLKELEIEPLKVSGSRSRANTIKSEKGGNGEEDLKIAPPLSGSVMGNGHSERPSMDIDGNHTIDGQDLAQRLKEANKPAVVSEQTATAQEDEDEEIKPYALMSIKELFRVLIELLDPHSKNHTDSMRIMALRIIDVALEVAGPSIAAQPNLAILVENDLCRHLFQLVRSDNVTLLHGSLRVAGTLLSTCRKLLKLQQELFLSYLVACLHPRVEIPQEPGIDPSLYQGVPQAPKLVKAAAAQGDGRATPVPVKERRQLGLEGSARKPEAREAMVESIGTLIRMPFFMVELFVNYDCKVDRQDLCEDMVGLLSRNAFPDAATWSTVNVPPLCLDSLLSYIQFMAERMDQPVPEGTSERLTSLRMQRQRKRIIKSGAAKFNDDPKSGVAFLVRNGIIDNPDDPVQIARFLRGTSHVSKAVSGEFITKKSNARLLEAFIGLFNFDGKRIDEALRDLLGSFRLPGESALIERIVTVFVEKYFNSDVPEGVADKDAGFVLTYAIIMLNTDLYNRNVRQQNRMKIEDFARNLRGVNAGKDFAIEYLEEIYDAIKQNEIILPEEHETKHAFDYAWKELLLKTHDAGELELCPTNAYDAEMFRATWKPVIATLCYVFMSASDDAVFSRVVVGFDQCAQLAAKYNVPEAFDRIIYSLSQIGNLAAEIPPSTSLNTEVSVGQRKVMVSELAVRLGRDFKAQLSTVLLFRILNGHEIAIGETWIYLVRILRNLFVNSLISTPDIESRLSKFEPIPLQPPSQVIDRDGKLADSGLFSSFTSYLSSYAADDPPEPSEEELENTLSSVDCVKACHCETFLTKLLALPSSQIKALVAALLSQLPEGPSPVVTVKPERPIPVTVRVNGHRGAQSGPQYSPGSIFLLELATVLTLRDDETVSVTGESLTGVLQNAVRSASTFHPLAASRIVRYLLDMLRFSFSHDFMRVPVVLHAISSFDDIVLDQTASSVMQGLSLCIAEHGTLRNEMTASPDFWSILERLHKHKTEASTVFDMLTAIATNTPTSVTADNYEATITLANDFATAGSIGSIQEQRRDLAARRGQKTRTPAPTDTNDIVQRGLTSINLIYSLTSRITILISQSHLERNEAWAAYWSPVFRSLTAQSLNPCRDIRHRAVSALQRTLLSEDLANDVGIRRQEHKEWIAIFHEVLFPLILRLLKPEIYQTDAIGMSETRIQAATLLCKIFLRYLDHLANLGDGQLVAVWIKVLELLDRLMNSGVGTKEGEGLEEAVGEGVKNCILVLSGCGYLVAPPDWTDDDTIKRKEQEGMWNETGRRIERFLPGLMAEVFPPSPPPPAPSLQPPQPQSQVPPSQLQAEPQVILTAEKTDVDPPSGNTIERKQNDEEAKEEENGHEKLTRQASVESEEEEEED